MVTHTQPDEITRWHEARLRRVTSAQGNLALVETRWLPEGDGTTLAEAQAGQPESVTVTELAQTNLDTGRPQRGFRFWDAQSRAIADFRDITRYPYNPDLVIRGTFAPRDEPRLVPFEHLRDGGLTRDETIPGDITFTVEGTEYRVDAFANGDALLLAFADATTGVESYAPGRFLIVECEGDVAVLDFNRAYVPPCGFSNQYNCPIPPQQNRFPFPIRAGEQHIVFAPGSPSAH